MTNAKHTPGPWSYAKCPCGHRACTQRTISVQGPMLDFIKDLLGINRYVVAWSYERVGRKFEGSTRGLWSRRNGRTKGHARRVARRMCKSYGPNSHWIERA